MKKLIAVVGMALSACSPAFAEISVRELFVRTEDKLVDFAIASSIEPVYYLDLINGRNEAGAQTPIVYVTNFLSCDLGYVTGTDNDARGSLAIGGSIRVNKIIEYYFSDKVEVAKFVLPQSDLIWNRLFFGPYISHRFVAGELSGGVKFGLKF